MAKAPPAEALWGWLVPIALAILSTTPANRPAAILLLVWLLVRQVRGDQPGSLALIIVSTTFVTARIGHLLTPTAAVLIFTICQVLRALGGRAVKSPAQILAAIVGLLFESVTLFAAPTTTAYGGFALLEQATLWALLIGLGIGLGNTRGLAWARCNQALIATAAVAGYYTLRDIHKLGTAFDHGRQVVGPYGGSNYVAALLAIAAVAAWATAHIRRDHPFTYGALTIVCCYMILPLASRTSTIVTGTALVMVLMLSRRSGRYVFLAIGIYAGAAAAASANLLVFHRIDQGVGGGLAASGRTQLWQQAWDLITANPLVGVGPGKFADLVIQQGSATSYAHNIVLSLCVQYGVFVGLALLLAMLPWKACRPSKLALAIVATEFAIALFEPTLDTLRLGIVFIVVAAAAANTEEQEPRNGDDVSGSRALPEPAGSVALSGNNPAQY